LVVHVTKLELGNEEIQTKLELGNKEIQTKLELGNEEKTTLSPGAPPPG
jgi:hypothetical protein